MLAEDWLRLAAPADERWQFRFVCSELDFFPHSRPLVAAAEFAPLGPLEFPFFQVICIISERQLAASQSAGLLSVTAARKVQEKGRSSAEAVQEQCKSRASEQAVK